MRRRQAVLVLGSLVLIANAVPASNMGFGLGDRGMPVTAALGESHGDSPSVPLTLLFSSSWPDAETRARGVEGVRVLVVLREDDGGTSDEGFGEAWRDHVVAELVPDWSGLATVESLASVASVELDVPLGRLSDLEPGEYDLVALVEWSDAESSRSCASSRRVRVAAGERERPRE